MNLETLLLMTLAGIFMAPLVVLSLYLVLRYALLLWRLIFHESLLEHQ